MSDEKKEVPLRAAELHLLAKNAHAFARTGDPERNVEARAWWMRLIGEAWRLRAKVRYQAQRIRDLEGGTTTDAIIKKHERALSAIDREKLAKYPGWLDEALRVGKEAAAKCEALEADLKEAREAMAVVREVSDCPIGTDMRAHIVTMVREIDRARAGQPIAEPLLAELHEMAQTWDQRGTPSESCVHELYDWVSRMRTQTTATRDAAAEKE